LLSKPSLVPWWHLSLFLFCNRQKLEQRQEGFKILNHTNFWFIEYYKIITVLSLQIGIINFFLILRGIINPRDTHSCFTCQHSRRDRKLLTSAIINLYIIKILVRGACEEETCFI
jgi:hypothetical protein